MEDISTVFSCEPIKMTNKKRENCNSSGTYSNTSKCSKQQKQRGPSEDSGNSVNGEVSVSDILNKTNKVLYCDTNINTSTVSLSDLRNVFYSSVTDKGKEHEDSMAENSNVDKNKETRKDTSTEPTNI